MYTQIYAYYIYIYTERERERFTRCIAIIITPLLWAARQGNVVHRSIA